VSVLPIMFLGGGGSGFGGDGGAGGGGDSVGGSVTGVTDNVGGCGGVTGGTGSGTGRSLIGVAGGSVSCKCGGARLAQRYLATHPGAPCFDSFTRSVVFRVFLFKVREDMLGAVSGPEHQGPVVPFVEPHFSSTFCFSCPPTAPSYGAPHFSSTSLISGKGANSSAKHFTSALPSLVSNRQLQSRRLADLEPAVT
jgi:hypothetical protein